MTPIFWPINISLAIATAILSLWMLIIAFKNRRSIKSRITNYFAIFTSLIFIESVTATGVYFLLSLNYGPDVAIPLIPLNTLMLLSIIFLAWILRQ
jgi:hypothetical protein